MADDLLLKEWETLDEEFSGLQVNNRSLFSSSKFFVHSIRKLIGNTKQMQLALLNYSPSA